MKYKDWLNEWLKLYVKPATKIRTYKKYQRQIEIHILLALGEYELHELTATVLQRFTVNLSEKGLSANTVNGIISVLKFSLKRAVLLGVTEKEFTAAIVRPKQREKQVDCLSKEEQRKIEQYIFEKKKNNLFGVVLCLYTGLRIGELLALSWKDIDFEKGILTVSKTCRDGNINGKHIKISDTPKTENSRRQIPLSKTILKMLKEMKKKSTCGFLIADGEKPVFVRTYQRMFELLLIKLKLPHKGFHSLRHMFATRALECGMDVKTLSEILGHKNPTVTLNRYAHSLLEHKAAMMNRLGKLL